MNEDSGGEPAEERPGDGSGEDEPCDLADNERGDSIFPMSLRDMGTQILVKLESGHG